MHLRVDRHSGLPVYRQLVEQVRFQVTSGILAPGAELPSTRALSAELGLNPMTVSKAYGLLEREGWVERRPGLALVVADQPAGERERERDERLREALLPAATAALLLGVEPEAALEVFGRILNAERERTNHATPPS